jgi:hypothetical protein
MAYFHAITNGRHRKCAIRSLLSEDGEIIGQENIQEHIYQFYMGLMGTKEPKFIALQANCWLGNEIVFAEDNDDLALSFTSEELEEVLKGTKTATALGPDGFLVVFFKKNWGLIKDMVFQILNGFALGTMDVSRLNFGILSLLLKVVGDESIKQFRPIALINVIFKFIAKVVANRLSLVAHRIIAPTQTTFVKGRLILDGALSLHEIIHELKCRNSKAILLKLDFKKAYGRVSWQFLREVLIRKGFESGFVHRIMQLVTGGQTAIAINGVVGTYFRNKRGMRQGDPLSPLLFDLVVDALALILKKASVAGHIKGVISHLLPGGITHLQYADDTMILIENDDTSINNLKFLLICFQLLSGLKINYHKSEVIVMGVSGQEQSRVANLLNCKEGEFPFRYLGFPISDKKLTIVELEPIVATVGSRVDPWQGRFLSSAAHLILIDTCLSSMPLHSMSLFLLPDGTHAGFDKHRCMIFWEGTGEKRKQHWVNWHEVCQPKDQGGLGITNTRIMNIALLVKWIWRLFKEAPEDTLWHRIIRAKYPGAADIFASNPQGGSSFWRSLHKIKHYFKLGARFSVGNGTKVRFWTDIWIGDSPLSSRFVRLFKSQLILRASFPSSLGMADGT